MTIYILCLDLPYEPGDIISVHKSYETAHKRQIKEGIKDISKVYYLKIYEYELEE